MARRRSGYYDPFSQMVGGGGQNPFRWMDEMDMLADADAMRDMQRKLLEKEMEPQIHYYPSEEQEREKTARMEQEALDSMIRQRRGIKELNALEGPTRLLTQMSQMQGAPGGQGQGPARGHEQLLTIRKQKMAYEKQLDTLSTKEPESEDAKAELKQRRADIKARIAALDQEEAALQGSGAKLDKNYQPGAVKFKGVDMGLVRPGQSSEDYRKEFQSRQADQGSGLDELIKKAAGLPSKEPGGGETGGPGDAGGKQPPRPERSLDRLLSTNKKLAQAMDSPEVDKISQSPAFLAEMKRKFPGGWGEKEQMQVLLRALMQSKEWKKQMQGQHDGYTGEQIQNMRRRPY